MFIFGRDWELFAQPVIKDILSYFWAFFEALVELRHFTPIYRNGFSQITEAVILFARIQIDVINNVQDALYNFWIRVWLIGKLIQPRCKYRASTFIDEACANIIVFELVLDFV